MNLPLRKRRPSTLYVAFMDSCVLQLCYFAHKVYSHLKVFRLISPDTPGAAYESITENYNPLIGIVFL